MNLEKALTLLVGDSDLPVVTHYRLGLLVHKIYNEKVCRGEKVKLQKGTASSSEFYRALNILKQNGILSPVSHLPSSVFAVLGREKSSAKDIACAIDPFCYVSHLSAMEYHGLTDRISKKIILTSPSTPNWKAAAAQRMEKDLGDALPEYKKNNLPELKRVRFTKVGREEVLFHNSSHYGAYVRVPDRMMRVSSIGRTFLDMLRDPDLCGGLLHVMDVFEENGEKYLKLILNEFDRHGTAIDKVRAGYILNENMKIENDVLTSWEQYAQRGGSRKLDASAEYIPEWSEKWCLSLNAFR